MKRCHLIAALFVVVASARALWVLQYAAAVPFFDQWDELYHKLRPWQNGTWQLGDLILPHNEHRVLFTRLFAMAFTAVNGGVFDNLVMALANVVLYAGLWTLVYVLLTRNAGRKAQVGLLLFVAVLASLPVDYENLLVGFQNAFYFMVIGAIALVALATCRRLSATGILVLALLALINLFTMASGLLAPLAVCVVIALRLWQRDVRNVQAFVAIGAMLLAACLGLYLVPAGVPHSPYSQSFAEHARALLICMSWPLEPLTWLSALVAALFWMPVCIWLVRFRRARQASRDELFAIGMSAWVFLQFLAIAHARGHDLTALNSRYGEIPAIGLVSNFWIWLKLLGAAAQRGKSLARAGISVGVVLVAIVFWQRIPDYLLQLKYRSQYSAAETWHVRRFFAGYPLPALAPGTPLLPYPDIDVLRRYLADADMRRLLPPALFDVPDLTRRTPLSSLAASMQQHVRTLFPSLTDELSIAPLRSVSTAAVAVPVNRLCSLDWINTAYTPVAVLIHAGDMLHLSGWFADSDRHAPPSTTMTLLNESNGYVLPLRLEDPRRDIEHALNSPKAFRSGFSRLASTQSMRPGTYHILLGTNPDAVDTCDTYRKLKVLPPRPQNPAGG